MDLGLVQREAAARIGVHVTTLTNWEVGRTDPALVHLPALFDFLGYVPYDPAWPVSRLLRARRQAMGLTQKDLARKVGVDPGTVATWDRGASQPSSVPLQRLRALFLVSLHDKRGSGS